MSRSTTSRRRTTLWWILLGLTLLLVPDAALRPAPYSLVQVSRAEGVDHSKDVLWILALGSDARPGQRPLHLRADAIQMVGVNLRTGSGAVIGIPRDSWVPIRGHGRNRVNAALTYGGPALMARTVTDLVGVRPDYVFTADFDGFRAMVQAIGGVTVRSRLGFRDDNMRGHIRKGPNHLNGFQALFFSRARHFLPRGDFDRSANQQEMLRAILRRVRSQADRPGFMERSLLSVVRNLYTNLSPRELYQLAHGLTAVDPGRFRGCVLGGSFARIRGKSVVLPDRAQARRLGREARNDAAFGPGC